MNPLEVTSKISSCSGRSIDVVINLLNLVISVLVSNFSISENRMRYYYLPTLLANMFHFSILMGNNDKEMHNIKSLSLGCLLGSGAFRCAV